MGLSILLGIIGPMEVVAILAIAVLLFGGKKIPELMKGIGQGMKEFKKAIKDEPKGDSNGEQKKNIEKE